MAIRIDDPKICTFIHVPKTAGTSIEKWMSDNFKTQSTKGKKHCTLEESNILLPGPLGITFCVVRNPWDWCVSWYQFSFERAKRRLNYINDKDIISTKKKYNKQEQIDIIANCEKGFNYWLHDFTKVSQSYWAKDIEYVLKFENLVQDFKKIQDLTNCYIPLKHLNKSNRTNYKDYYDLSLKKLVELRYADDIELFNYSFD